MNLDFKFKPFVPEYLPAVGDIDAFLKIAPPETTLGGKPFDSDKLHLGLVVLDEPAANQSDPALLHLRLRSSSVHSNNSANVVSFYITLDWRNNGYCTGVNAQFSNAGCEES